MTVQDALNFDDLRAQAKRYLPRIVFDYIEGGVEDEDGLARNAEAFRRRALVPRYLVDVSGRTQETRLFGRDYAAPFGIAPTGLAGMARHGADLMLARAAAKANVPFVLSGAGNASIEEAAAAAPEHAWFQLYAARDKSISEDMVRRAADAGMPVLVLTVDVPTHVKRERNRRNGLGRPLRLPLRTRLDALRHPGWLASWLRRGMPSFAAWAPYAGEGADADKVADFIASQTAAPLNWEDAETFRRLWPRAFVLKGILHPSDAVRAAELGADGVIVSNHGARQLDRAPAALDALPAVKAAVGDRVTVMYDSGIRRGSDVLTALCLGAAFAFIGRPALYGAAAGGEAGARHAVERLRGEIHDTMGQIGAASPSDLGPDFVFDPGDRRNAPEP